MNYLLSLNKKYLIIVIAFIITIALFVFIYETINTSLLQKKTVNFKINRSDITKPKFTINSENQKISISANEGNFLNNDEILLKNDVVFESNRIVMFIAFDIKKGALLK